ncbi:hypothetical protein SDC9_143348 [bioreactor metagenome]|uniref:Uncharacterized protein n=1 Tax=bioreactor metagenome TaxID=1076179 RepID=A0A645E349_9ZZZZ
MPLIINARFAVEHMILTPLELFTPKGLYSAINEAAVKLPSKIVNMAISCVTV